MGAFMSTETKRCFVIMPFSETTRYHTEKYWTEHYENFLKPTINSCSKIEAFRSVPLRQDILRQIINDLVFSPIVVADLTDSNPNVYWELGVRLSFRQGTITIAEEDSTIPFDIKTKGVIFYSQEIDKRDNFKKQFIEAINDCISNPERPDSIVLETITGRGSVYSVIYHQQNMQRLEGLMEEINRNISDIDLIYERINWNKSRKLSSLRMTWGVILTSLAHSSLDLLLAERYIEKEKSFYSKANLVLCIIYSINQSLSNWSTEKSTSKWFLKNESHIKRLFESFYDCLVQIKQEYQTKC
jgi:hypothetical protein